MYSVINSALLDPLVKAIQLRLFLYTDRFKTQEITVEEVDRVIFQHMKRGKAAGFDNLTLEHLTLKPRL